jgi:hypothetical protein
MSQQNVNEGTGEVFDEEEEVKPTMVLRREDLAPVETATAAAAALAETTIKSRYALARRFPRNNDDVLVNLKRECQRPQFAEVARYVRPVGKEKNDEGVWEDKFAEGPSIRFAEAAARYMGNIDAGVATIFDDREKRILRVYATDMETNTAFAKELTVAKTLERRKLKRGQTAIGHRVNSYGDPVFIVRAEDSEIVVKEAAEVSKVLRTLLLRLVPGWVIDECMKVVLETQKKGDAENPTAARMKLVEAYARIGVRAADLEALIGHSLDGVSPAELARLRGILAAILSGEARWKDVVAAETATEADAKKDPRIAKAQEAVQAKIDEQRKKAEAKPAAPAADAQPQQGAQPAAAAQAASEAKPEAEKPTEAAADSDAHKKTRRQQPAEQPAQAQQQPAAGKPAADPKPTDSPTGRQPGED